MADKNNSYYPIMLQVHGNHEKISTLQRRDDTIKQYIRESTDKSSCSSLDNNVRIRMLIKIYCFGMYMAFCHSYLLDQQEEHDTLLLFQQLLPRE